MYFVFLLLIIDYYIYILLSFHHTLYGYDKLKGDMYFYLSIKCLYMYCFVLLYPDISN